MRIRRFFPFAPDFLFEFISRVFPRFDTVGGGCALLVSLFIDSDATVGAIRLVTALRVAGVLALFYGCYDVYREERVMRSGRLANVRARFAKKPVERVSGGVWLQEVSAEVNVELEAARDRPVLFDTIAALVLYHHPRARRYLWLFRSQKTAALLIPNERPEPFIVEPAKPPERITLNFDEKIGTTGHGEVRLRGNHGYYLAIQSKSPTENYHVPVEQPWL